MHNRSTLNRIRLICEEALAESERPDTLGVGAPVLHGPWSHDDVKIMDADGNLAALIYGRGESTLAVRGRAIAALPNLLSAILALGAMPEGFCVCSKNRDPQSEDHEPECYDLRDALTEAGINVAG